MERKKKRPILGIFLLIFGSISVPIRGMEDMPEKPLEVSDLSLDEKIGQLLVIATVSNTAQNLEFMEKSPYQLHPNSTEDAVRQHHVGGVIFLGASYPKKQIECTNRLQKTSKHPLLVGQDLEWGLSMRHTQDVVTFPKALTLGAIAEEDELLIEELGREIAYECNAIGVHMNMAPVADVNSNPKNPIINVRSFGDDPQSVARKAELFMRGMKNGKIFSCAKHFPGHGDTDTDSHVALPIVRHNRKHLDQVELTPFKHLIDAGVPAIMTGHLAVAAITESETTPATLSSKTIELLRNELGFDGLIVTDGMGMGAVQEGREPGEAEFEALKAGHDIILCPKDVFATTERIKKGLKNEEISEEKIDEHVKRILRIKNGIQTKSPEYDKHVLNSRYAKHLKKRLYESALTLVHDTSHQLPLQCNQNKAILILSYSSDGRISHDTPFMQKLNTFPNFKYEYDPEVPPQFKLEQAAEKMKEYNHIIVSLHLPSRSGMIELEHQNSNEGLVPPYVSLINKLAEKVILVLFGSPYNLKYFTNTGATIVAYENEPEAQEAAAELIAGKRHARGILPIKVN